jgi:NTE family protein
VLKKLLIEKAEGKHDYEVVALSGTSGGAICALLSWYGLLMNDTNRAVELLDSFWRDNSASSLQDKLVNDWLLWTNRFFENTGGMPTISPYYYPSRGQDLLRSMLEKHVDFGRINDLVKQSSPLLLVGAANVLSGEFKAFSSHRDKINADMILASAAIPTLFRAVHTDGGVYWDGLFSQNPPVRELPDAVPKPNEIWVIQINPETSESEPKSMPDITDRRNELSGNLSLYQEIHFIKTVNKWVEEGSLSGTKHEVIDIKWIQMLRDLDSASKLNRDPSFVQKMMAYGEEQAEKFLKESSPVVGAGSTG